MDIFITDITTQNFEEFVRALFNYAQLGFDLEQVSKFQAIVYRPENKWRVIIRREVKEVKL